jgi:hypothetical protein
MNNALFSSSACRAFTKALSTIARVLYTSLLLAKIVFEIIRLCRLATALPLPLSLPLPFFFDGASSRILSGIMSSGSVGEANVEEEVSK